MRALDTSTGDRCGATKLLRAFATAGELAETIRYRVAGTNDLAQETKRRHDELGCIGFVRIYKRNDSFKRIVVFGLRVPARLQCRKWHRSHVRVRLHAGP
jgi:hypothetical protein